jgi:DNA-binding beta-propeller fold protein YncE
VRTVPEPYDLGGTAHPAIAADSSGAWVANAAPSVGGVDRIPGAAGAAGATHVSLPGASAVAIGDGAVWATSDPGSRKNGSVVRIDAKSGLITKRHAIGPSPVDVALANGEVWVALRASGDVVRLDASTLAQRGRVHVGAGISRLAADGSTIWVLNKTTSTVTRIDSRTATVVGVPIDLGKQLQDISAGGGALWIAGSDSTVTRLNASGIHVGTPIAVGAPPLALASDGAGVWVASGADNSVISITTR